MLHIGGQHPASVEQCGVMPTASHRSIQAGNKSIWDGDALKFQTMHSVMSVKNLPVVVNWPAHFSDCSPAVLQLEAFGNMYFTVVKKTWYCQPRLIKVCQACAENEVDAHVEQHANFRLGAIKMSLRSA